MSISSQRAPPGRASSSGCASRTRTPEPITITASYQLGAGQGEAAEISYEVGAKRRKTIYVPAEVGGGKDVSVYLTSEADFLAERPMYFSYSYAGLSARGGDCVIGATSASRKLRFAEGYTGEGFHTWLCIQNPGTYAATIRVYFYTQEEGLKETEPIDIPGKSRYTLMVNDYIGSAYQLSCEVVALTSSGLVVERAMYFDYGGWDGGHIVVGYAP